VNKHLYTIVEIMNVIVCIHFLYGKKLVLNRINLSLICFDLLIFELMRLYGLNQILTMAVYLFIFLYPLFMAENNFRRAAISSMLMVILLSLLPLLTGTPFMYFIPDIFRADDIALIGNSLTLLLLVIGKNFLNRLFQLLCSRNEIVYIAIALFFAGIIIHLNLYKTSKELSFEQLFFLLVFGFLIVVLSYCWQKEREQLHIKEMEIKMHEIYDASFQNLIASVKEKQHDFHNHLQTLENLRYTTHTYEELVREQEKYCSELKENPRYYNLLNIPNPVLAGFLYGKFLDADKRQVSIDFSISILQRYHTIPEYVLVEMIGILWDNALEYVTEKEYSKYISIRLEETQKSMEIEVGNPIDDISYEDIAEFFRWGKSGKENHSGIGLNKLIKYRDKYKFLLIANKRENQGSIWFYVKIVINRKPPHFNDCFFM